MKKEENIKSINEDIARRFASIEAELKDVFDITALFETLFNEVERQFQIPFVWLSLIKNENTFPIIKAVESSDKLKTRLNLISKQVFDELIKNGVEPVLINKKLKPYYKFFPESKKYFLKSLAVVPLCLQNEIIGSWNNGDVFAERYSQDMDTDFLQKFAKVISERITELTKISC